MKINILYAFLILMLIPSCAIILKNPVIVSNDNSNGSVYFKKELEEVSNSTREQTSRRQTAVSASFKKTMGDDMSVVNDQIEQYDRQRVEQTKKVEQTLQSDSSSTTKTVLELMRIQLIDAKIRRTLCKNNYLTIQADSLSTANDIKESKECWSNAEQQVMKLTTEIRNIKTKYNIK